jgi:hypothetical protein
MPHSYAQNTVHLIFSTKDRRKLLPKEFQPKLWAYVAGVLQEPPDRSRGDRWNRRSYSSAHSDSRAFEPVGGGASDQIEFVKMVE